MLVRARASGCGPNERTSLQNEEDETQCHARQARSADNDAFREPRPARRTLARKAELAFGFSVPLLGFVHRDPTDEIRMMEHRISFLNVS